MSADRTTLVVPSALRNSVASVHGLHAAGSSREEVPLIWLPRRDSQLVVHVTSCGAVRANVSGPSTLAKYKFFVPGPFYVQFIFQPDAARAVFGVPVHELADRVVDLEQVWGRGAHELIERVAARREDPQAAVSAVEHLLAERIRTGAGTRGARLARHATEALATTDEPANVRRLAGELGVSERSLRQAFLDHVGLSPKRYARVARILHVVAEAGSASWARLAAQHGFYDQAHLNAEFRAFLRVTPSQYLAKQLPFVRPALPATSA
ncbi:MAG TPA: helix-turn-helix domain-containing protein [Kofleriaceae bacterium]|nr:helix-turn-helix domain-containing protein [Kofleriaceae bacterium]